MRYDIPETNDDEDPDYPVQPYVSDQTAFMRWGTELEKIHDLIDKDFLQRHKERVIDINKFLPMANITNPKSIKLFRLRRMNIDLARDANLIELAEETALDNVADYNTTRGQDGFYQKALITTRREWEDKTKQKEKQSLFNRLVKKNQEQEQNEQMVGGY